jgi:hypothetical protein
MGKCDLQSKHLLFQTINQIKMYAPLTGGNPSEIKDTKDKDKKIFRQMGNT